jgi:hypothetical protein
VLNLATYRENTLEKPAERTGFVWPLIGSLKPTKTCDCMYKGGQHLGHVTSARP